MRKRDTRGAKILLVDDHPLMRKGLRSLLESEAGFSVVGEAGDGTEALQQVEALRPDVVVMDVNMPGMGGMETTTRLLAKSPATKVVTLSMYGEKHFVDEMLRAGAAAYVLKDSAPEDLVRAIQAALRGECFLSPPILGAVVSGYRESVRSKAAPFILQTKLHRSALPSDMVVRAAVLDRLDAGRALPLTLVSAPPGYGKSVLIASWLERAAAPSAWIALDRDDSDVRRFVSYVVAAIRRLFPDACEESLGLVTGAGQPPTDALAATLCNELDGLGSPLILVLDDYHLLRVDSAANELVQLVLARPPAGLHLVIVTRRDPPIPLALLRSRGQMHEIRMRDLRFHAAEARELLDAAAGFRVADEALEHVERELEGWVAGLRLVALSLRREPDPVAVLERLRGGIQHAQQYLINEVLEGQPIPVRHLLLRTSILDRFSAPLCLALATNPVAGRMEPALDVEALVRTLLGENLFVIPLDAEGEWFRYHPLFQELLAVELNRAARPAEVAALHATASGWFEDRGLPDEAVRHALAAGDVEGAARVVERYAPAMLNKGHLFVAARWLAQIPRDVVQARVGLLRAEAWQQYYATESRALSATLDRIDEVTGGAGASPPSADVPALRAWCALVEADAAGAVHHAQRAIASANRPEDLATARSLAETVFGLGGQMNGQRESTSRTLTRWLVDRSARDPGGEVNLTQTLAFMAYVAADPPGAGTLLERARRVATAADLVHLVPRSDYLDGLLHVQRGELAEALPFLGYVRQGKYLHLLRSTVDALCAQVLAYQAMGNTQEALGGLRGLEQFVRESQPSCIPLVDACAVRRALLAGDTEPAAAWLKTNPAPEPEAMLWWFEVPALTWCRALVADGTPARLREAEERLRDHAAMNEAQHNTCQLIAVLCLLAVARRKLGEHAHAALALEQALTLAEPGGFVFPFLEAAPALEELRKAVGAVHDRFLEQVFRPVRSAAAASSPSPAESGRAAQSRAGGEASRASIEVLTNRELDILELLAERLQNKEIAERLSIAPETVNYHLKHIYQKLSVQSRRQAVVTALHLGLLQERSGRRPGEGTAG